MDGSSANLPGRYELPLPHARSAVPGDEQGDAAALPDSVLIAYVRWFCRLRWVAVGLLAGFGVLSFVPGLFRSIGLRPRAYWAPVIAAVVAALNLAFLSHASRLRPGAAPGGGGASLRVQIAVDLCVLTAVVHFVGTGTTYVMFGYLFHIVLACIFFSREQSLIAVLISACLFMACLALEASGVLPAASVFSESSRVAAAQAMKPVMVITNAASAQVIWLVVWYLTSRLSDTVRARDRALAATNRRLIAAQEERARHMLRTTHELKAPFAAIYSNAQLLLKGRCGDLPPRAHAVVSRIGARSRRLAREIQDMLQLANLSSPSTEPLPPVDLDLAAVLAWCVTQVKPLAEEREMTIVLDAPTDPVPIRGVDDHLKMLFINLLANAVTYSHPGERVSVTCSVPGPGRADVVIADRGIGIPPEKLPRIFEEYYRTEEAVTHCPESTGLGLAIVRHVAETYGIRIRVTSRVGEGTTFELGFGNAPKE